jgi:hypothetical protein
MLKESTSSHRVLSQHNICFITRNKINEEKVKEKNERISVR